MTLLSAVVQRIRAYVFQRSETGEKIVSSHHCSLQAMSLTGGAPSESSVRARSMRGSVFTQ